MAMGSRLRTPTLPVAAAVVSDDSVAPRNTPCCQFRDWNTSGTVRWRRAPKSIAEIGTPSGFSQSGEIDGQRLAWVVKRLFGCAAFSVDFGVHGLPCQSSAFSGGGSSGSSHQ